MFAQTMTEATVNATGGASELRHFHTTYGETFGYNERARKYHRSYGLVTPPNNPAFTDYRLGDLATAPLFRRDHLGFRVEYPHNEYTWSDQGAKGLKKNQKRYGEDEVTSPKSGTSNSTSSNSFSGTLPKRTVNFYAHDDRRSELESQQPSGRRETGEDIEELERHRREFETTFQQRQAQLSRQAREEEVKQQDAAQARAVLTSSLSPTRERSASAKGQNPLLQKDDYLNRNLYPNPAFKTSDINPQFDPRR